MRLQMTLSVFVSFVLMKEIFMMLQFKTKKHLEKSEATTTKKKSETIIRSEQSTDSSAVLSGR